MNKISLIIAREYLTRIRNKTFLLSTFLTPLFFVALIGFSVWMQMYQFEEQRVAVYDESGLFASHLPPGDKLQYVPVGRAVYDSFIRATEMPGSYTGLLHIPQIIVERPTGVQYFGEKNLGLFTQERIERDLNKILERERMVRAHIDTNKLADISRNQISILQKIISEEENHQATSAGLASAIGYASGFLLYMLMFIYGSMVMRGVMEEKTSRVAEVIVSSVKPMELMMGKIVGIGAVGITQFLIWVILLAIGSMAFSAMMSPGDAHAVIQASQAGAPDAAMKAKISGAIFDVTSQINIPLIIGCFLFYFVSGYLLYAAMFAAVGSAVNEDPQDAQALMFPITIPIVVSFIMMTSVVGNPTGAMALWGSIIPFTAPIIMMARIPYGIGTVQIWELVASMVLMVGGFLFMTWLSGRIYRTGILMYGKKVNWVDLLQWAFRKQ